MKALYPTASLQSTNDFNMDYLFIPVENGYIKIPRKDLTKREEELLSLITVEEQVDAAKHPWYSFLFENKPMSQLGKYRIIQVEIRNSHFPLKKIWIDEIRQIFPNIVDFFFTNETTAIIIEKESKDYLCTNDFEGIFLALDIDFDVSTKLFIGPFHTVNLNFPVFFIEEQKIFIENSSNLKCTDITSAAISFYSSASIRDSFLLAELFNIWIKESEMLEIIPILWKNLGNVSSTSKDLFMHRNTLLYKIDKFFSETGINLKEANDLFLCYLLVLNFHP